MVLHFYTSVKEYTFTIDSNAEPVWYCYYIVVACGYHGFDNFHSRRNFSASNL